MISLDTINQINQIMTVLNNTKAKLNNAKGGNFAQALQQTTVQTPAQTVQQTMIKPNVDYSHSPLFSKMVCCICGKPGTHEDKGKWYCKDHNANTVIGVE